MINILMSRSILGSKELVNELEHVIKKEHKVAILLYSFFDKDLPTQADYEQYYASDGEYVQKMVDSFSPYGIPSSHISFIDYYHDSHEVAKKKIEDADIIYFPGGAPDLMMKRINEKDLKHSLEDHQKIYIGSSAGAMIQFKTYHISKDYDYERFSYEEGLHLLQGFSVEVHYRRRKKQKAAMRKVFRAFHHPILTIPDDGAIMIHDDEITLIETADVMYDHRGIFR
jgi:peptidase E